MWVIFFVEYQLILAIITCEGDPATFARDQFYLEALEMKDFLSGELAN